MRAADDAVREVAKYLKDFLDGASAAIGLGRDHGPSWLQPIVDVATYVVMGIVLLVSALVILLIVVALGYTAWRWLADHCGDLLLRLRYRGRDAKALSRLRTRRRRRVRPEPSAAQSTPRRRGIHWIVDSRGIVTPAW